jgi:sulfoxide reductase heme-binding subunit YedZ
LSTPADSPRRSSYWQRRLARHAKLALVSLCIGAIVWTLSRHDSVAEGFSFATAYAGLVLLAVALAVGPMNVLRRRPNPVSTDLRRDVGIWAGLCGVAHTVAGLQVHMRGHFVRYFLPAPGTHVDGGAAVFLTANYLGMTGAILLLVLMSISNDIALRKLGVPRWKLLQRSTYVVLAAVVFHGTLYQLLEKRAALLVIVFAAITVIVVVLQLTGLRAKLAEGSVRSEAPEPL